MFHWGAPTFRGRRSNFFQGWGGHTNANFYRNPYNLLFSGRSRPPIPPSGSAHAMTLVHIACQKSGNLTRGTGGEGHDWRVKGQKEILDRP